MRILGLDPGQRHVGVCIREGADSFYCQVDTSTEPVVESTFLIEEGLARVVCEAKRTGPIEVVCLERQISTGAKASALMFCMMITALRVLRKELPDAKMVMPLPIQLMSYMKKRGVPTANASSIVRHHRETEAPSKRLSQHQVDAFYLTKAAEEVILGTWEYKLPTTEKAPGAFAITWRSENGEQG